MKAHENFAENKFAPLVRRVLTASKAPYFNEFGKHGEFTYLVEDDITQNDVEIYDALIESVQASGQPTGGFQEVRNAIQPYVGKQLLRAGMRLPGRQYEFRIDPAMETVVHCLVRQNDSSVNMNLEWIYTVQDDAEFRHWLDSVLFPEFFDESAFEESHTLYHVELQDSLLEDAIYQGIESARFQKADLNAAIRDASSSLYGYSRAMWFHVNVHDNLARVVEQFGSYSFDCPLAPIYTLLQHHAAKEGGTTYAGVASSHREWLLLFSDSLHISVHGEKRFVDHVIEFLEQTK